MVIEQDKSRRRFLVNATTVVGATGIAAASWPFIASMNPSEKARQSGAAIRIDLSKIEPGQQITVEWRQKPVWILRRTLAMLESMNQTKHLNRLRDPDSEVTSQQPAFAQNPTRSLNPGYLVVIGLCTHLGCVPSFRPERAPQDLGAEWIGGYYCPCHGSQFDLAGRVFQGVPAPTNLVVPSYQYVSETVIEIGINSTDPEADKSDKLTQV